MDLAQEPRKSLLWAWGSGICSLKGARAEAPGKQGPHFSGVSNPLGPEESSLAPGTLKLTPGPLARGPRFVLRPQEGTRRSTLFFFVLKTQEALAAGVWVSAPLNAPFQATAFLPVHSALGPQRSILNGHGGAGRALKGRGDQVFGREHRSWREGDREEAHVPGRKGHSVPESPRNQQRRGLNRGLQELSRAPGRRQPASATEPLPAALPQGAAPAATPLMCPVGKIPLGGTFPGLPTWCLPKSVFTARGRPGPRGGRAAASHRGHRAPFLGGWVPSAGTRPRPRACGCSSSGQECMD